MSTLLLTERELHRVIALLVESKKEEFLKKKYNVSDDIINKLKEIDPTPNNKYLEWLIKTEVLDSWWTHRRPKISQYLSYYSKDNIRKSLPKEYQDINRIDGISDFIKIMEKVNPADFISKTEAYDQTYKGKAGRFKVYQPTTYSQSCKLGSGTNWCTSADSDEGRSSFEHYTRYGDILLIFIDGDEKYQWSSRGEFMDKENERATIPNDIFLWLVDNGYKEITIEDKLIYDLPLTEEDLHVKGDLNLRDNKSLRELPDGLRIDNHLILADTNIEKLPNDLYVGGSLNLFNNNAIKELPDDMKVGKHYILTYTNIEKLPDNLTVYGTLNLENSGIKELPKGLRVEGFLTIAHTDIEKLPNDLYVEGNLFIRGTPLTKYTSDEIRSMVKHIGGEIRYY